MTARSVTVLLVCRLDLLNWPVPATEGEDLEEDTRTIAELRAELADAHAELRRLRARLAHVEDERERLERLVSQRGRPTARADAEAGD